MKRRYILCAIISVLTLGMAHGEHLTFGLYSSEKPTVLYTKFKPLLNHIQEELHKNNIDLEIQLKIVKSYEQGINNLAFGEFDFARFGAASYILAKRKNSKIKLMVIENKAGKKSFKGIFITRKNSEIKSLKDLKSKKVKFAFGSKNSTIGRFISQQQLLKNGLRTSHFKEHKYLGRHDIVALAVLKGQFDVGVVKSSTFNKYQERGLVAISDFDVAPKPWAVREGFPPALYKKIQEILLNIKQGHHSLRSLKSDGFLPTAETDYDAIRAGMKASREFTRVEYEN